MPSDEVAESIPRKKAPLKKDSQGKNLNHNMIEPLELTCSPQEILNIKNAVHKEVIYHMPKEGSYTGF